MKNMPFILLIIIFICFNSCQNEPKTEAESPQEKLRIVSLNGSLTELVFELGKADNLVGTDVTSTYPEAAKSLPKLGHVRQLNPEGVLALNPDIILVDEASADSPVLKTLKESGIRIISIDIAQNLNAPVLAARELLKVFDDDAAQKAVANLEEKIARQKKQLETLIAQQQEKPKVLFLYARGTKTLMVSGTGTSMSAMIELAGGRNAVTAFEDFKALTPEALLQAAPDVLLLFESGLKSLEEDGLNDAFDVLLALPAMSQTPAGKNKKIVAIDGQFLSGFGPRVVEAAIDLHQKIQP